MNTVQNSLGFKSRLSIFLLFSLVFALKSRAQVSSSYTFATSAGTYTAISGGTQAYGATYDDNAIVTATMPSFNFNGVNYTSVSISPNGYLTFGATLPTTAGYTPISSTTTYSGAISAFGADLTNSAFPLPEIRYQSVGNEFVVQWTEARRYLSTGERMSFQIRLNNVTNAISIIYGGTIANGTSGTGLQIGLRGSSSADYNNRTTAGAWSGTTAGGANNSSCAFNASSAPTTGRTFTWTRSTCTPPTTQATAFSQSAAGTTTATVNWTRGNGNNVMVVASTSPITTDPVAGTAYTANAAFGSGTALGGGFVVYSGAGTSVSLTALTGNTTYYFSAFEFNTTGTCYNQAQVEGTATTSNPNTSLTIGTGTSTSSGSYYGSFYNYYENNKTQFIYNKSEMGAIASTLTFMAFDVSYITTDVSKRDFDNFTIKLMHTTSNGFSGAYLNTAAATTVYTNVDYNMPTATGWLTFDITDFAYNGTGNLLVEITWGDNAEYCGISDYYRTYQTDYSAGGEYLTVFGYADAVTPPSYAGQSYLRPNVRFTMAACATAGGMATSSASSVSSCEETTTLSLSGQTGGSSLQWQWSPNNVNWYVIAGATTSTEESPYISRATEYFRTAVTNGGCTSVSTNTIVTSSSAASCFFWEGDKSTVFLTNGNWSSNSYPNSTTADVYIPRGVPNLCTYISATGSISTGDFYIQEGGTLDYQHDALTNTIWINGNLVVNGAITFTGNPQGYLAMVGAGKTVTQGAVGDMSSVRFQISGAGSNITLGSNIKVWEFLVYSNGTANLGSYTLECMYFNNNTASSTMNMNTGVLKVAGGTTFDKSGPHLTGKTNPYFESGTVNFNTGTVYYNAGENWPAINQTVKDASYYDLKIRTNNGFVATIGTAAGVTATHDLILLNPGTAGGVATTAFNSVCNGTVFIGNTDNALTFNLGHRITRTTGTGTTAFTMGNNDAHIINVTYAHATNWAISLGASAATSNLIFYGTVNYNNAAAQKVMGNTYKNVVIVGAGSRSLTTNTTVTNNITISAGTLTAGTGYSLNVGGTWTNNATFTHSNGMVTLDGTANQSITGSTTTTFYNFTNNNSSSGLTLNRGIVVNNNLTMSGATADIFLNGFDIDLSSAGNLVGESNTDRIYGTSGVVKTTRVLNNISAMDIAGMGIELTTTADMGSTTVRRGHSASAGVGLTNSTILRYFDISPANNTGLNATLKMYYYDNEMNGLGASEDDFKLFRSTDGGANWTNRVGTENTAGNFNSLGGIDAFSIWTLSPEAVVALPVALVRFEGWKIGETSNQLKWVTESEINCDYFVLERSSDGFSFVYVDELDGAGNSLQAKEYATLDKDVRDEINYYRLIQVDIDGQAFFSDIISIDNRKTQKQISKIVNLIGQEVDQQFKGVVIIVYSDNTSIKTIQNL
jgi:hypothetical protein